MSVINRLVALVAGAVLVAASHGMATAQGVSPDDSAKFIAGMAPSAGSALTPLTRSEGWRRHANWFDSNWSTLERQRLSKIRAWSERHLKDRQHTLYYMFSGPDFLHADGFFPTATNYLLSAREPIGAIPKITERTIGSLPRIQQAIGTSLRLSFFITKQMRSQLAGGGELAGTLPILLAFAARSGKTIHEITLVNLDNDGNLHPAAGEVRGMTPGVKIVLSSGDGPRQNLYYFQTDLSDGGTANSGFLKFAATLGPGHSLIKSASYLLHTNYFNRVRDFILTHSQSVVQDDSGIPFAQFRPDTWNFFPFGNYRGPISIFANRHQPRLGDLFRNAKEPLDFGIGYRHRGGDSNLLLAVRKEQLKMAAPPSGREIAADEKTVPAPKPE
jgi:hypothetical protein